MAEHSKAQNLSRVQFNEFKQADFYTAGDAVDKPHYRIEVKVLQGTMKNDTKETLTASLPDLILNIEWLN